MSLFGGMLGGAGGSGSSLFGGVTDAPTLSSAGASLVADEEVAFTKQDGSATVTLSAAVELVGNFRREVYGGTTHELSSRSVQSFKVTTAEDPGDTLGASLESDDSVQWKGLNLLVVGTSIQAASGGNWVTMAELTA